MTDYQWLIIGGGLHGRFIASTIIDSTPEARLAIIDPEPPLARWHRRSATCGMQFLRSSISHHLGLRADSLRQFAKTHNYGPAHFLGRYRRPSLTLFNHHAETVLGRPEHLRTSAEYITRAHSGWWVHLADQRRAHARHVVIATGPGRPYRPTGLAGAEHLYDDEFTLGKPGERTVIIGGGISGGQLALQAVAAGHRVCWITRHWPQTCVFDSLPCYAGPKCLGPFFAAPLRERSRLITVARQPGTLPPDIHDGVVRCIKDKTLSWQSGHPEHLTDNGVLLMDGRHVTADRIILATGFDNTASPSSLIGRTIENFNLVGDDAGHLDVNPALEVAPGLHIAGRAASLQLGPMAGNIVGARRAGRLLATIARCEDQPRQVDVVV